MSALPLSPILRYHEASRLDRDKPRGGSISWRNRPIHPKQYASLPRLGIQAPEERPEAPLSALREAPLAQSAPISMNTLSSLLAMAHAVTAQYRGMGEMVRLLSYPSAGGLYPCELYVRASGVSGLPDGLYYHDPFAFELISLPARVDDDRPGLAFYITAVTHRAAWKYSVRAYRYCLLDAGHLLENLLLASRAMGLALSPVYEFDDTAVNRMLCLDPQREVCLTAAAMDPALPPPQEPEHGCETVTAASRCAPDDNPLPEIVAVHEATSVSFSRPLALPALAEISAMPEAHGDSFTKAVFRRRSQRRYISDPLAHWKLDYLLGLLGTLEAGGVISVGIIAESVQGHAPGMYLLKQVDGLKRLRDGLLAHELASACLHQTWMANASVLIAIWADLRALELGLGARSYRLAHLLAGQLGQRTYLTASALDLGCCGVGAFHDDEAAQALGLSADERLLYCLTFGPVRG